MDVAVRVATQEVGDHQHRQIIADGQGWRHLDAEAGAAGASSCSSSAAWSRMATALGSSCVPRALRRRDLPTRSKSGAEHRSNSLGAVLAADWEGRYAPLPAKDCLPGGGDEDFELAVAVAHIQKMDKVYQNYRIVGSIALAYSSGCIHRTEHPMAQFGVEQVLSVRHWSDNLFSFRTTRSPAALRERPVRHDGLEVEGRPLTRAYSVASPQLRAPFFFFQHQRSPMGR